jgi:hypothetical protein
MMHFLALSPDATAYYVGLEQRRLNARHHVRKILALAEIYPADAGAHTFVRRRPASSIFPARSYLNRGQRRQFSSVSECHCHRSEATITHEHTLRVAQLL